MCGVKSVFDLFKAFVLEQEQSQIGNVFKKWPIYIHKCATRAELPYNISALVGTVVATLMLKTCNF